MPVIDFRHAVLRLAFVWLLSLLCAPAMAAKLHAPGLHWMTMETPHFYIHYSDGLEPLAQKVANLSEDIHREVSGYLDWQPRQHTHITLSDGIDLANGFATPLPYNQIVLFVTPPTDINSLEDFDDWLELVLRHEYVHTVHLDKADGVPRRLRNIFGRVPVPLYIFPLFPNVFLPNWFLEGIATHIETKEDIGVGRGQSSYFRALMRNEVANGIKSLDSINMLPVSWPSGTSWYLYGVYFFRFLEDTYGKQAINMLIDDYSRFPIFYLVNANAKRVLGKDYHELWKEFERYLQKEFGAEIAQQQQQLHAGQALSDSGYQSGFSRVDAQGNVYYIEDDRLGPRKLKRRNLDGSIDIVAKELDGWYFDWHEQQGILATQLEASKNVRRYFDLYRIDPRSGEETRLTHNARYHTASWSPDGQRIIAVHHEAGRYALHLLNADGEKLQSVWQAEDDTIIGALDWSPTGDKIVASVWRPGQSWNLELFDLQSQQWRALTSGDEVEAQPQFDASGERILFTADYQGIYNIYALRLDNGERQQLTRVIGGAFYPSLSQDDTLYYSGLTAGGNQLYRMPASAVATTYVRSIDTSPVPAPQNIKTQYLRHEYQPLSYMQPRWWLPHYTSNDVESLLGVETAGQDVLGWHSYTLSAAFETNNSLPYWLISYQYDRWLPTFTLANARSYQYAQFNNGDTAIINTVDSYLAFMQWPWIQRQFQQNLTLGGQYETEKQHWRSNHVPPDFINDAQDETLGSIIYQFTNTELGPRAISQHSGIKTTLRAERQLNTGRTYEGKRAVAEQWLYTPPLAQSVFALRGLAGVQSQSMEKFEFSKVTTLSEQQTDIGKHSYALRGYPSGLAKFRGNAINLATLEWRTPLATVENGIMLPPLGLRRVHAKLFGEAGRIWQWEQHPTAFSRSVGAEVTLETVLGFKFYIDVVLGYARGVDELGEEQLYARINVPMF